jgi:CPA2 family monovalent cation:H+ antiporter-2
VPLAFGYSARTALLVGAALAQVGEFSFVLARQGLAQGAIPQQLYGLTLAAALVTILLSPFLVRAVGPLHRALLRLPLLGSRLAEPATPYLGGQPPTRNHVVIGGYGGVGREVAQALARRGFQYLVLELDPRRVAALRREGVPVIFGDAANPAVLEHAGLGQARLLVATMPDTRSAELAVRHARQASSRLDIIARAQSGRDVPRLRAAGADEVVHPQFEAGLEIVRHALRRFGVSPQEVELVVGRRRAAHYQPDGAAG